MGIKWLESDWLEIRWLHCEWLGIKWLELGRKWQLVGEELVVERLVGSSINLGEQLVGEQVVVERLLGIKLL